MRIATFNINGINRRLGNLLAWLDAARPDIACVQELKSAQHAFPEKEIAAAGYRAVWRGQQTWNGVAILSRREPVLIRRSLPGDAEDTQARYLEAAIGGIVVVSIYAPNGNPQPGPKFDYKLAWLDRLIAHAFSLFRARVPVVLAGDFNIVPTDADIYSTRSWRDDALLQPASRAAFRRLLAQGWTDAIRSRHPDAAIYTFWDYMRNRWARDAGLRIDHLLLSDELASRLTGAGVDRAVRGEPNASDHAPAWVQLSATTGKGSGRSRARRKR